MPQTSLPCSCHRVGTKVFCHLSQMACQYRSLSQARLHTSPPKGHEGWQTSTLPDWTKGNFTTSSGL
jgi:hypothetical protein